MTHRVKRYISTLTIIIPKRGNISKTKMYFRVLGKSEAKQHSFERKCTKSMSRSMERRVGEGGCVGVLNIYYNSWGKGVLVLIDR